MKTFDELQSYLKESQRYKGHVLEPIEGFGKKKKIRVIFDFSKALRDGDQAALIFKSLKEAKGAIDMFNDWLKKWKSGDKSTNFQDIYGKMNLNFAAEMGDITEK